MNGINPFLPLDPLQPRFGNEKAGRVKKQIPSSNRKARSPLALWISFDGMKTWPYQRVLVEHSSDGPGRSMNYPDGFVSDDKQWLHFAYDDNRHRAVHYSAKLPSLP
jgi:hypothetical protein